MQHPSAPQFQPNSGRVINFIILWPLLFSLLGALHQDPEALPTPKVATESKLTAHQEESSNDNTEGHDHSSGAMMPQPWLRFCVSGNAPLIGSPVVDRAGRLYFLSSDGYLHAFEEDGRYRFSYTVKGSPRGNLTLRQSDSAILLGTASRYLYAISQSGAQIFKRRTLSPVWSGITPLSDNSIAFVGLDRRIYALYANGGSRYRVKMPSAITGEILVTRPGLVWVPLKRGVARLEDSFNLQRIALGASIKQLIPFKDGIIAQSEQEIFILDSAGKLTHTISSIVAAGEIEHGLAYILKQDGSLTTISDRGQGADRLKEFTLQKFNSLSISAAPLVYRDGENIVSLVPTTSGDLLISRNGKIRRLKISKESLATPVRGRNGQFYVPSASGRICAIKNHELP